MKGNTIKILPNGTTVEYLEMIKGEVVTLEGIIVGYKVDDNKRNLRGLVYQIKDNDKDEIQEISHKYVQETILCKSCGLDLLENGIDDKVWITYTYNRESRKTESVTSQILDCDCYTCSYCGADVSDEDLARLSKYLDI